MADDLGINSRISVGDHANTSELSNKNFLNNVFLCGVRLELIQMVRSR